MYLTLMWAHDSKYTQKGVFKRAAFLWHLQLQDLNSTALKDILSLQNWLLWVQVSGQEESVWRWKVAKAPVWAVGTFVCWGSCRCTNLFQLSKTMDGLHLCWKTWGAMNKRRLKTRLLTPDALLHRNSTTTHISETSNLPKEQREKNKTKKDFFSNLNNSFGICQSKLSWSWFGVLYLTMFLI